MTALKIVPLRWRASVILSLTISASVSEGFAQDSSFLKFATPYDTLIVASDQIVDVALQMRERDVAVVVRVDPSLSRDFARITRKAVGEDMVLTLCGREIMRPRILNELDVSTFVLSGNTLSEAQSIADRLQSKGCQTPIS